MARRQPIRPPLNPIDLASRMDRLYFLTHPRASEYTRPYHHGECLLGDVTEAGEPFAQVTAYYVSPVLRMRCFLIADSDNTRYIVFDGDTRAAVEQAKRYMAMQTAPTFTLLGEVGK